MAMIATSIPQERMSLGERAALGSSSVLLSVGAAIRPRPTRLVHCSVSSLSPQSVMRTGLGARRDRNESRWHGDNNTGFEE
jgi:hypothetical protein